MKKTICVVDDERNVRIFLRDLLEQEHYTVYEAANGKEAQELVGKRKPHIIILDLNLPDANGLDLIRPMKQESPLSQIIVITALGTVDNAVGSMKQGAFDFITKPFDVENILISIRRAVDFAEVSRENLALRTQQKNRIYYEEFIGISQPVERIRNLVLKLSNTDVPVLISGETGTGKNVLAKQIHFSLSEPDAPIVYTNCSSIPDTLFESELFGYEKGAFTGAETSKRGRIEDAHGGTLILDEISEIPYEIQAKLLDFLQEHTFYRVGGTKPLHVDLRVIAISNRDLQTEIEQGRFRKDLLYRLNIIHFQIPPLRERTEDIEALAEYFMDVFRRKYGMEGKHLSPRCLDYFRSYAWPGNVREMKNVIERAFICCEGDEITECDTVYEEQNGAVVSLDLRERLADYERSIIIESLVRNGGNRTHTANELHISLRNLQYKIERYDIQN